MKKGIFVTGTDTGVGKTIVSAILIRSLMKKGLRVGVMKPIETGCQIAKDENGKGVLYPSDGAFLKMVASIEESLDLITPSRFELPLAPMVASDIEGVSIDIKKILDSYNLLKKRYDFMVIEGVGGILVPIMRTMIGSLEKKIYFVSDLIRDFGLSALVVTRPGLGTINHTLLTVDYLIKLGIDVKGIVINYHRPPDNTAAEKTNPSVLKEICPVPLLATFPYLEKVSIEGIDNLLEKQWILENLLDRIS